jgi:DNA polymerase III psi subunit
MFRPAEIKTYCELSLMVFSLKTYRTARIPGNKLAGILAAVIKKQIRLVVVGSNPLKNRAIINRHLKAASAQSNHAATL